MRTDPNHRLSPHFTLGELTRSQAATIRGIPNDPDETQLAALTALCTEVLEPLRSHFGKPIVVSSGFRCAKVNRLVGGTHTSQHCRGEAADFTIPGISNLVVAKRLATYAVFDQLIYEFGESGWIHVSYSMPPRGQVLSAKRIAGRTKFLRGLV